MQDFNYNDSSFDPLEGKIIARMPDLGQGQEVPKSQRLKQPSASTERVGNVTVVFSPDADQREDDEQEPKTRTTGSFISDLFNWKKFFHIRCFVAAVILVLCLGGIAVHKLEKKKRKIRNREIAVQKAEEKIQIADKIAKTAKKQNTENTLPTATVKPQATVVKPAPVAKSAVLANTDVKPEKTPAPTKASAEKSVANSVKPQGDTKQSLTAEVVTVQAKDELVKTGKPSDSPWDRSVTDAYSPWTMSSTDRLKSAALSTEEKQITAENVIPSMVPSTFPQAAVSVPVVPELDRVAMAPIPPLQSAYPQPVYQLNYPQVPMSYPNQYPTQVPVNPSLQPVPPYAQTNPYPGNNPNNYASTYPNSYPNGYAQVIPPTMSYPSNSSYQSYQSPQPNTPPANNAAVPQSGQYPLQQPATYPTPYPSQPMVQPTTGGQYNRPYPPPMTNSYPPGNYYQQGNAPVPYRRVF